MGIGASAGGLEAYESFFKIIPEKTGMAFILVSHLDPTHISILPELITKQTKMKVFQIEDGQTIESNHVYVIPPNKDLSILNGSLFLLELSMPGDLICPLIIFPDPWPRTRVPMQSVSSFREPAQTEPWV